MDGAQLATAYIGLPRRYNVLVNLAAVEVHSAFTSDVHAACRLSTIDVDLGPGDCYLAIQDVNATTT